MLSINYQLRSLSFKPEATTFTYLYTEETSLKTVDDDCESIHEKELVSEKEECNQIHLRERIVTYFRDEILVVSVSEIACIYTDNSITYVVTMDGQKSTTNCSLDHLIMQLDGHDFFRINRQIILGVSAIKKIIRLGQGLKILTQPSIDIRVFVGKNKALRFKNWLNS
jgi:DNA-binding LytR/AlgR family response regulator